MELLAHRGTQTIPKWPLILMMLRPLSPEHQSWSQDEGYGKKRCVQAHLCSGEEGVVGS
jgi:hypothetical protein